MNQNETINQIKNILADKDLKLVKRIELQDKTNGRVYK